MGLKPAPVTVVLVQESVEARLHSDGLSHDERDRLQQFKSDLDRYLVGSSL